MSGHSKWSNIKRKKSAEDAKRGRLFTRLARDITVAARDGGKNVSTNPALRAAIEKAKAGNLPKANIKRAVARGVGELEGTTIEEAIYEGYGPGGVAFLIKCLTDNRNRTVSEIRNLFNRNGGSLADAGSVSYIFSGIPPAPSFTVPLDGNDLIKFNKLNEELESLDEVVDIYHNAQI